MIGQQVLPTPELVFEPLLPELALVVFAIARPPLRGVREAVRAPRPPVDRARRRRARRGHQPVAVELGRAGRRGSEPALTVLGGTIASDRFAVLARLLLLVVAALGLLLGHQYFARSGDEQRGEFAPLLLFATSGMTLIVASADLIVTFLALEILSLSPSTSSPGSPGRRAANEASMKYFLLGAFSSAFFLYGVAMAYGATGHDEDRRDGDRPDRPGRHAGARGARSSRSSRWGSASRSRRRRSTCGRPTSTRAPRRPVTAYMSAATKIAAFAALIRVLDVAFQALAWDWAPVVWGLAAALGGGREHPRDRADEREADARVLEHRARRIHPDRADGSRLRRASGPRCSTWWRTRR